MGAHGCKCRKGADFVGYIDADDRKKKQMRDEAYEDYLFDAFYNDEGTLKTKYSELTPEEIEEIQDNIILIEALKEHDCSQKEDDDQPNMDNFCLSEDQAENRKECISPSIQNKEKVSDGPFKTTKEERREAYEDYLFDAFYDDDGVIKKKYSDLTPEEVNDISQNIALVEALKENEMDRVVPKKAQIQKGIKNVQIETEKQKNTYDVTAANDQYEEIVMNGDFISSRGDIKNVDELTPAEQKRAKIIYPDWYAQQLDNQTEKLESVADMGICELSGRVKECLMTSDNVFNMAINNNENEIYGFLSLSDECLCNVSCENNGKIYLLPDCFIGTKPYPACIENKGCFNVDRYDNLLNNWILETKKGNKVFVDIKIKYSSEFAIELVKVEYEVFSAEHRYIYSEIAVIANNESMKKFEIVCSGQISNRIFVDMAERLVSKTKNHIEKSASNIINYLELIHKYSDDFGDDYVRYLERSFMGIMNLENKEQNKTMHLLTELKTNKNINDLSNGLSISGEKVMVYLKAPEEIAAIYGTNRLIQIYTNMILSLDIPEAKAVEKSGRLLYSGYVDIDENVEFRIGKKNSYKDYYDDEDNISMLGMVDKMDQASARYKAGKLRNTDIVNTIMFLKKICKEDDAQNIFSDILKILVNDSNKQVLEECYRSLKISFADKKNGGCSYD